MAADGGAIAGGEGDGFIWHGGQKGTVKEWKGI